MDKCQNVIDKHEIKIKDHPAKLNMGQSESKKDEIKQKSTKGTSMSFGFKKLQFAGHKNNSIQSNNNSTKNTENKIGRDTPSAAKVISSSNIVTRKDINRDFNGSPDSLEECNFRNGRSTRIRPPKKDSSGMPYRSTRFGFRQSNIIRPVSVGLIPKTNNLSSAINNNEIVGKRCSKGSFDSQKATLTTRCTGDNTQQINEQSSHNFTISKKSGREECNKIDNNVSSNITQEYSHPINDENTPIDTNFHLNNIVCPKPQVMSSTSEHLVAKFTLHTTSLPRLQYPVPISLTSHCKKNTVIDEKVAKHEINSSRQNSTVRRETSSDSGVGSIDFRHLRYGTQCSQQRFRSRNLEMVVSSGYKFEEPDLDDSLSDESVVPLSLPKLPSAFYSSHQRSLLSGLIYVDDCDGTLNSLSGTNNIKNIENCERLSLSSSTDSVTEEKGFRDNSTFEKCLLKINKCKLKQNKHTFRTSTRTLWDHGGESMALNDCCSISSCSSQEYNKKTKQQDDKDTISKDIYFSANTVANNVSSGEMYLNYGGNKFEEIATSAALLDNESSPTNSFDSTPDCENKGNKKQLESSSSYSNIQLHQIDLSNNSPGSPTNATDSFSQSENYREFLIDDEIEDQPNLCYDDKSVGKAEIHTHSNAESGTGKKILSAISTSFGQKYYTNYHLLSSYAPEIQPTVSILSKTESLEAISPCDSIGSEDMMLDFECRGESMDSINGINFPESTSKQNSVNEHELLSNLESVGNHLLREWNSLLLPCSSIKTKSPSRAERLLNRSRLQSSIQASDSDNNMSPTNSLTEHPTLQKSKMCHKIASTDKCAFFDNTVRNSLLQDFVDFKNHLLNLRILLLETDPHNPFEGGNIEIVKNSAQKDCPYKGDENNLTRSSSDDEHQKLSDLRRQVVYLQDFRINDEIIEFHSANISNCKNILGISALVNQCVNKQLCVNILRENTTYYFRLTPCAWPGRGFLDCNMSFIQYKYV